MQMNKQVQQKATQREVCCPDLSVAPPGIPMPTSVEQMRESANAAVPKIAGAVNVTRGILEFRADAELPS